MAVIGVALLIILVAYIYMNYKKSGFFIFLDISKIALIIWMLVLALYDLGLSTLIKPNSLINMVVLMIILNFAFVGVLVRKTPLYLKQLSNNIDNQYIPKTYKMFIYFYFALGLLAFIVTFKTYGFTILNQNKISRTEISYGYLYNALVVCFLFFYFIFRFQKNIVKKLWQFIMFIVVMAMLICLLNRGNLLYIGVGIVIIEAMVYYQKKNDVFLSKKVIVLVVLALLGFIYLFGYIGEMRYEYVGKYIYKVTYVERYGFKKGFPSGFGQLYMYLASPLENFSYIIEHSKVDNYTMFANLFYPFIKVFADMVGYGDLFVNWIANTYELSPILWEKAGLNVMSFMADAYQDFRYLGIAVYLLFYDIEIIMARNVLKSKMLGVSKVIIYSLMIQLIIWSPFDNSVFRIATIWVDIALVFVADYVVRRIKIKM